MKTALPEKQLRQMLLYELRKVPGAKHVRDMALCRVRPGIAAYDWTVSMLVGPISDRAAIYLLRQVIPTCQAKYSLADVLAVAVVDDD